MKSALNVPGRGMTWRVWLPLALAACACVALMMMQYLQQRAIGAGLETQATFQQLRARLTGGTLEIIAAAPAKDAARLREGIAQARAGLDLVATLPPSAADDPEARRLDEALREIRVVLAQIEAHPERHTALFAPFGRLNQVFAERAARVLQRQATLRDRQRELFYAVSGLALLLIGLAAAGAMQTRRKTLIAEARIERLDRLRLAHAQINNEAVRGADFSVLAHTVCRIAVEEGGMECAVVRMLDANKTHLVPLAFHAPRTGLIGREVVAVDDPIGVSVSAFRDKTAVVIGDLAAHPVTHHAAEYGERYGVHSTAAFPVISDGAPVGTFAVFGLERSRFDAESIRLLEDIASALGFAYSKLEASRALRENEARYRTLFDITREAIVVVADGRIRMINAAAARLVCALDSSEVINRSPLDFVPAEYHELTTRRLRAAIVEGLASPSWETDWLRLDGSRVEVDATMLPYSFDGKPAAIAIARDLTERRAAERELRQREHDLRVAQQAGRISSVALDLRNGAISVTEAGLDMLGLPRSTRLDIDALTQLVPSDQRQQVAERVRANVDLPGATESDFEIVRPVDGERRWIHFIAQTEFDANGRPARRVGIMQDITERRIAESALNRSEQRLRMAMRIARAGLWDWDLTSGIAFLDGDYKRMLGYDDDALVADAGFFVMITHPDDRGIASAALEQTWLGKHPAADYEQRMLKKDGTVMWARVLAQVVERDRRGRPLRMVGLTTDVSDRKAVEMRLARLNQLREAQSRVNEAVARHSDYRELAEAVCRIAVDIGGVKCALVRRVDPADGLLVPVAWYGPETGFIGREKLPADGSAGVSSVAFASARPSIVADMRGNAVTIHAASQDIARKGVHSAAAFPLLESGRAFGTFAVFGPGTGYFDDEMAALLTETAASLAFAHGKFALEAAHLASEREYRKLIDASPMGIAVACQGHIVLANPAALRMYDYDSVEAMSGIDLLDFVHPEQRKETALRLQAAMVERKAAPLFETVHLRRDGTPFPVQIASIPIEFQGQPAMLSIGQDLSEKQKAERDLRLAQEAGRIGVVIVDGASGTWSGSPVAFDILGLPYAEARPIDEFFTLLRPQDGGENVDRARQNVASGTRTDTVYRIARTEGGTRWVRVTTDIAPGMQGPKARRIGTVQDVTDIKEAELSIRRMSNIHAALARTNAAIARDTSIEDVCAVVCDIALAELGMHSVAIRRHNPERDTLVTVAMRGHAAPGIWREEAPVANPRGVTSAAFRQRAPVIVNDMTQSELTSHVVELVKPDGTGAFAAFPLMAGGQPLGTLSLSAPRDSFDAAFTALLGEIADALGFALAKHASDQARREGERRMESIVGTAMDAIITCDDAMRIVVFNAAASNMFRLDAAQALGSRLDDLLPPRFRADHRSWMRAFAVDPGAARSMGRRPVTARRADGREFPAEASISHTEVGGRTFYTVIMRDVTEQLASERRIARLSGFYAALSRANEAMARQRDWQALCDSVCRLIVEFGQVKSALIRMPRFDGRILEPFAGYGPDTAREDVASIALDSGHPAAIAFREMQSVVTNDLLAESRFAGSSDEAANRGVRAAIVLPLVEDGRAIGALTVFAEEADHFDDELTRLMGDLAGDLAFAFGRLRSDAAIRESETRYRTLIDASPDAVRVISDDRIVLANAAYENLFGASAGKSVEEAILGRVVPGMRARVRARMREVIEERRVAPAEEQVALRADGTPVPVEATSVPFVIDGRPASLTIIRDLTERKARERAQRETERRFRSLVETSMSGIVVTHEARYEYVNPGFLAILGFDDPSAFLGRHVTAFVAPGDVDAVLANMEKIGRSAGGKIPPSRLRMVHRDGHIIDMMSTAISVEIDGRVLVHSEVRDITRELKAKADLQALNRELEDRVAARTAELTEANRNLESANRDMESFSYSVAHDLRAPARTMTGFANLLAMDVADGNQEAMENHVGRIVANAERMNSLIDGLLSVARVSHGALVEELVPCDALVAEVLRDIEPPDTTRIEVGSLPVVSGDPATLRQVWTNLLSNAVKYSAKVEHPRVDVTSRMEGGECVFTVRDNGAGFDPSYASKLFGVFQRLHTNKEFEGNGVGLAIVRRIVERHGGRVWAEGAPGKGASFHFSLPAARIVASASLATSDIGKP